MAHKIQIMYIEILAPIKLSHNFQDHQQTTVSTNRSRAALMVTQLLTSDRRHQARHKLPTSIHLLREGVQNHSDICSLLNWAPNIFVSLWVSELTRCCIEPGKVSEQVVILFSLSTPMPSMVRWDTPLYDCPPQCPPWWDTLYDCPLLYCRCPSVSTSSTCGSLIWHNMRKPCAADQLHSGIMRHVTWERIVKCNATLCASITDKALSCMEKY